MSKKPVLAIPACEPGRGSGHIIRCMKLVQELREHGRDAFLYLADNEKTKRLVRESQFNTAWITGENSDNASWECIVFDRFQCPPAEFARLKACAPLIGIDEGGPCRAMFDFLIDILPGLARTGLARNNRRGRAQVPNISNPSLLPLPEKKERKTGRAAGEQLKVLVSFGQEDSAGLGPAVAQALAEKNKSGILDITLCTAQRLIPNLCEHLFEYDLVITHYGITAFEALYAGAPVALVSPGAYHEKLARASGFFSVGTGKGRAAKLARLLIANKGLDNTFLQKLKVRCAKLAARYNLSAKNSQTLAALIEGCAPVVSRKCRVCGAALQGMAVRRFPERTYCRCPACGIISMSRLGPPPVQYSRDYFFDSYKKQYGKTYLDDFPNLLAIGKRRLGLIMGIRDRGIGIREQGSGIRDNEQSAMGNARNNSLLLLDIGCAYGPFLAAAKEAGFSPFGIDPSEDAVRYVTQTLKLPAIQGFFPLHAPRSTIPGPQLYDVISLWYVIEHFENCLEALAEIRKLLKPGGILAFSTPSYSGVSGRSSLRRFLESSPPDHWTVWPERACKKALKKAGFTVKKIVSTGHHPERFPLLGRFAKSKKSPLYGMFIAISRIFRLADTFEVYAKMEPGTL